MSANNTILELSSEMGFDTDNVSEALSFLIKEDAVDRFPVDDVLGPDDITVVKSTRNLLELRVVTPSEGTLSMIIEAVGAQLSVTDVWTESGDFIDEW